jgi:hypothetical protein
MNIRVRLNRGLAGGQSAKEKVEVGSAALRQIGLPKSVSGARLVAFDLSVEVYDAMVDRAKLEGVTLHGLCRRALSSFLASEGSWPGDWKT